MLLDIRWYVLATCTLPVYSIGTSCFHVLFAMGGIHVYVYLLVWCLIYMAALLMMCILNIFWGFMVTWWGKTVAISASLPTKPSKNARAFSEYAQLALKITPIQSTASEHSWRWSSHSKLHTIPQCQNSSVFCTVMALYSGRMFRSRWHCNLHS